MEHSPSASSAAVSRSRAVNYCNSRTLTTACCMGPCYIFQGVAAGVTYPAAVFNSNACCAQLTLIQTQSQTSNPWPGVEQGCQSECTGPGVDQDLISIELSFRLASLVRLESPPVLDCQITPPLPNLAPHAACRDLLLYQTRCSSSFCNMYHSHTG
jgi:hypothetical protein